MGKEKHIQPIKANLDLFKNDPLTVFSLKGPTVQPWNGLESGEETLDFVKDTISLLNTAIERDLLQNLPINYLTSINNSLSSFNSQYTAIKAFSNAQLQNQHHAPLAQLNSIDNQLRTMGLYSKIKLSPDIPKTAKTIAEQLENVTAAQGKLIILTKQVEELLSPSVADALSRAFNDRKDNIAKQKFYWLIGTIASILLAIGVTIYFTEKLGHTVEKMIKANADTLSLSIIWIFRVLLLFPTYFLVIFCFRQFAKERKLEEIYAHKASVSKTLPSYSELVKAELVKDQITSSASKVVFTMPENEKTNKSNKDILPNNFNEILEFITKVKNINKTE